MRDNERGSLSLMIVVLFAALAALAGIVVDGGAKLTGDENAAAVAQEAARAGATSVDASRAYATGNFAVDEQRCHGSPQLPERRGLPSVHRRSGRRGGGPGHRARHAAHQIPLAHRYRLIYLHRRCDRVAGDGRHGTVVTGRARTVLTGLAALAALLAIVGGLPVVLYRFGGSPLPRGMPGVHDLARRLASRDEGSAA